MFIIALILVIGFIVVLSFQWFVAWCLVRRIIGMDKRLEDMNNCYEAINNMLKKRVR